VRVSWAKSDPRSDWSVSGAITSVVMGAVVGLTFLFGFGNVLTLALRLGVLVYVAPLVAPAVDLTVVGLLVATRHLAQTGARAELRSARRLLLFASAATLALNVADPLIAGHWGRAAFDTVGPLLLIGWAGAGPAVLGAMASEEDRERDFGQRLVPEVAGDEVDEPVEADRLKPAPLVPSDLVDRARAENTRHWMEHRRPISAETLRRRLKIGATRSRALVAAVRMDGCVDRPSGLPFR
jgi:hypothetical protein